MVDTFREHQPQGSTESVQIVLHDENGLAAEKSRISAMLAQVGTLPHVAAVTDPFTANGSLSTDGKTAYSTVDLDVAAADMPVEDVRAIIHKAQEIARTGCRSSSEVTWSGPRPRAAAVVRRAPESLLHW